MPNFQYTNSSAILITVVKYKQAASIGGLFIFRRVQRDVRYWQ